MTKVNPTSSPAKPQTTEWYHGFDWLRFLLISFVLLMHLNFTQVMSGSVEKVTVYDVLQFNVFCMAVPGFLLLSSFLLVTHCQSWSAYAKKIKGMVALYLFWVSAWILVTKPAFEISLWGVIEFFLRGGGWAYYFFSALLINSFLTALFHRCSTKVIWWGFACSILISLAVFHAMAHHSHAWMGVATYWWPICFFPYFFCGDPCTALSIDSGRKSAPLVDHCDGTRCGDIWLCHDRVVILC